MKIICAWCGKYIGEHEGERTEEVSHGICEQCLNKIEKEIENDRQD